MGEVRKNRFADCQSIEEVIFQAIGAGSTCWDNLSGAGIFESEKAKEIGDDALEEIRRRAFLDG